MSNRVCEILGITKPVIQAPMAFITSPEMVAAVSEAGGLGTLGTRAGFTDHVRSSEDNARQMRESIRRTRERTSLPFAVNLMSRHDDMGQLSEALKAVCAEEGVPVVVLAGDEISKDEVRELKDAGFRIIARDLNPSVGGAKRLEEAGADIVVATGVDEGGCMPGGTTGTISITALLAANLEIPVLAGGGIVTGAIARAAAAAGAEGVFCGSRFILSEECPASPRAKEALLNSDPDEMIVFTQWDGRSKWRSTPTRVAIEALEQNVHGNMNPNSGNLRASMLMGELDKGVNSASDVISLVREINICKEIVDELARGFAEGCSNA